MRFAAALLSIACRQNSSAVRLSRAESGAFSTCERSMRDRLAGARAPQLLCGCVQINCFSTLQQQVLDYCVGLHASWINARFARQQLELCIFSLYDS